MHLRVSMPLRKLAHTKLEVYVVIWFIFHLIKKEREMCQINNLQFEQPYSSILIQILYLYATG